MALASSIAGDGADDVRQQAATLDSAQGEGQVARDPGMQRTHWRGARRKAVLASSMVEEARRQRATITETATTKAKGKRASEEGKVIAAEQHRGEEQQREAGDDAGDEAAGDLQQAGGEPANRAERTVEAWHCTEGRRVSGDRPPTCQLWRT